MDVEHVDAADANEMNAEVAKDAEEMEVKQERASKQCNLDGVGELASHVLGPPASRACQHFVGTVMQGVDRRWWVLPPSHVAL